MHTPTPWHVEEDGNGDTWIRIPRHDLYVCNLEGSCGECYGNAAFIVQACNAHDALVEALQDALAAIEHGVKVHPHSPCADEIRAALTLAAPKEAVR